jgi:hexosaminidase
MLFGVDRADDPRLRRPSRALRFNPFLCVSVSLWLFSSVALVQAATTHDLMPAPQKVELQAGHLAVDRGFTVASVGAPDARLDEALERLRSRVASQTGLALAAGRGSGAGATLVVKSGGPGLPVQAVGEDESYTLTVTPKQARLDAPTTLGVLRGMETFLQLLRQEQGRWVVPAAAITDRPRFPWRGLLIDPCRRWQPVEVVKRTLDGMAAVKMNVLHWHLSEDQGFRIESKTRPLLHEKGSDGLYYTQDQVRDVIAYARARGIRVVPEFDLPGHSTSWLTGYPELGVVPGPFTLIREWGIFDNVLDPSKDEVYTFLDAVFGEMAALFPDAYFHIGGDEVTPRQWNANPQVLDFMYRNNLGDLSDLQAHFNKRVNEILTRHGKRMVGWDEILRPELPKSIVVQSWRGAKALAEAARLGYDGILSNGYYLDLLHPASEHYLVDPLPADSTLTPEQRAHVLGGEACMWSEFVTPETIDSRLWPRGAAVAERLWSAADVRDVDDMYRRLEVQSLRLETVGAVHRKNQEALLQRIAGGAPTASLRVLADLVTPVRGYRRGQLRHYTSAMPLERLVDAAQADSLAVRTFRKGVETLLRAPAGPRDDAALRTILTTWRDNHRTLEPVLAASRLGAEARPLSRDVAALGELGLQALEAIRSGRQAPETWAGPARHALDRAQRPRAELELAPLPAVRKLVLAAAQLDALKGTSVEEWNRRLDEQVKEAGKPPADH